MHALGVAMCAVGSVTAGCTEGLALWGSLRRHRSLTEFYRRGGVGQRWFFSGLMLAVVGLALLYN